MSSHKIPTHDLDLPLGSLVLVTGATGFIASHVIATALSFGYRVRGTVRSEEKGATSRKTQKENSKYTTVVVPDITAPSAFNEAIKDVDGVIHIAGDMSYDSDPEKVIPAAKRATESLLEAAAKTPSVKRIVLTSSSKALTMPRPETKFHIHTKMWNNESVEEAWNTPPEKRSKVFGQVVYAAAKTEAERAAWMFVREHKPGFVLNTVLPNINMGTILPNVAPGQSGQVVLSIYGGRVYRNFPPQYMVDVEDNAKIHVACLVDKTVSEERVLAFAHPFNCNDVLGAIRRVRPQAKVIDDVEQRRDLSTVENERGAELLRKWWGQDGYRTLDETVKNNLAYLDKGL